MSQMQTARAAQPSTLADGQKDQGQGQGQGQKDHTALSLKESNTGMVVQVKNTNRDIMSQMRDRISQQNVVDQSPEATVVTESPQLKQALEPQTQAPLINIKVNDLYQQHQSPRTKTLLFQAPSLFNIDHSPVDPGTLRFANHQCMATGEGGTGEGSKKRVIGSTTSVAVDDEDDQNNSPTAQDDYGGMSPPSKVQLVPTMLDQTAFNSRNLTGDSIIQEESLVSNAANDDDSRDGVSPSPLRNAQNPSAGGGKKAIVNPLNLDKLLKKGSVEHSLDTGTTSRRVTGSRDPPPMSTRRKLQNTQTPLQRALEAKVLELSNSTVTQSIFYAIWKVVLTTCYKRDSLRAHMRKANLANVPIRAIHYSEILYLFRKAHGPILAVKKVLPSTDSHPHAKKASLIKPAQGFVNYQTFCKDVVRMLGDAVLLVEPPIYALVLQLVFEASSVQCRLPIKTDHSPGNGADDFEDSGDFEDDVIFMRRITDIQSPFNNQITDNLPVRKLFFLEHLEVIVKYFCMREISPSEEKRLIERRFIPQALTDTSLDHPKAPQPHSAHFQFYDNIDKVIQHCQWKESREENGSMLLTPPNNLHNSFRLTVDPEGRATQQLKKISHKSKVSHHTHHVTFPPSQPPPYCRQGTDQLDDHTHRRNQVLGYHQPQANGAGPIQSKQSDTSTSDAGGRTNKGQGNQSALQPKLPLSQTPQTVMSVDTPKRMVSPLGQPPDNETNSNQPIIKDVKPGQYGNDSKQFHVTVGASMLPPRTPQAYMTRPRGNKVINAETIAFGQASQGTDNTMDLSGSRGAPEQMSFQAAVLQAQSNRPITNEAASRAKKRDLGDQEGYEGDAKGVAQEGHLGRSVPMAVTGLLGEQLDKPLKLLDVMHTSTKYARLSQKNQTLEDAKQLTEIKQFDHYRQMFERMRKKAAELASKDSTASDVDQNTKNEEGESGNEDGMFVVQINSKGKLDTFNHNHGISPIAEANEHSPSGSKPKPNKTPDRQSIPLHSNKLRHHLHNHPTANRGGEVLTQTLHLDANQKLFDFKSLYATAGTANAVRKALQSQKREYRPTKDGSFDTFMDDEDEQGAPPTTRGGVYDDDDGEDDLFHEHLMNNQATSCNAQTQRSSVQKSYEGGDPLDAEQPSLCNQPTKDFMNANARFNTKNLLSCKRKNKLLIAQNQRKINKMRQQRGYNACLWTGKANYSNQQQYSTSPTARHTKKQTSRVVGKFRQNSGSPPQGVGSRGGKKRGIFAGGINYQGRQSFNLQYSSNGEQEEEVGDLFSPPQTSYLAPDSSEDQNRPSSHPYNQHLLQLTQQSTFDSSVITNLQIGTGGMHSPTQQTVSSSRGQQRTRPSGASRAIGAHRRTSKDSNVTSLTGSQRGPPGSYQLRSQGGQQAASAGQGNGGGGVRPRFIKVMSPESGATRLKSSQQETKKAEYLENAINCQTIPKLVENIQARKRLKTEVGVGTMTEQQAHLLSLAEQMKNAVPIRLHLARAGDERRTEFSPFSVHIKTEGNSGQQQSQKARSRDHARGIGINNTLALPDHSSNQYELSRAPHDDDGICTVRAESHLEATNILQTLQLKKTPTTQNSVIMSSSRVGGGTAQKNSKSKAESSLATKPTKIILIAPPGQRRAAQFQEQSDAESPSVGTSMLPIDAQRLVVSKKLTGSVNPTSARGEHYQDAALLPPYPAQLNRVRVISTADQSSRPKPLHQPDEVSGVRATITPGHTGAHGGGRGSDEKNFGEVADGQIKISLLLQESKNKAQQKSKTSARSSQQAAATAHQQPTNTQGAGAGQPGQGLLRDFNRWKGSNEGSPDLVIDGSPQQSVEAQEQKSLDSQGRDKGTAAAAANFLRQKPRDVHDIDHQLKSSGQKKGQVATSVGPPPPQTSHQAAQFALKEASGLQRNHLGEFIAPRRALTRKQRHKRKAPLHLLPMQDLKGARAFDVSIINPDLVTSRHDTETVKLSQSTRSPELRKPQRRISIQDPRLAPLTSGGSPFYLKPQQPQTTKVSNALSPGAGRRTPTPIKIVDLSAQPEELSRRDTTMLIQASQRGQSINQEYQRHYPLLKNRQGPLKQEVLAHIMPLLQSSVETIQGSTQVAKETRPAQKGGSLTDRSKSFEPTFKTLRPGARSPIRNKTRQAQKSKANGGAGVFAPQTELNLKEIVSYLVSSPLTSPKMGNSPQAKTQALPRLVKSLNQP